jgi:hypothetical protein
LLITWLTQPIKEEVVVVEDVEETEVMENVALVVVEDVYVETVETVVVEDVPDVVRPRRRPGSPSPSLVVS